MTQDKKYNNLKSTMGQNSNSNLSRQKYVKVKIKAQGIRNVFIFVVCAMVWKINCSLNIMILCSS